MRRSFFTIILTFVLILPVSPRGASSASSLSSSSASSQFPAPVSSSSVPVDPREGLVLLIERLGQSEKKAYGDLLPPINNQETFIDATNAYQKNARDLRLQCSTLERAANRTTIVRVQSTCLRSMLLQEIKYLQKVKTYILVFPALVSSERSSIAENLTKLIEAEQAVIDGIDTGVYTQTSNLVTVKLKLHEQYRRMERDGLRSMIRTSEIRWFQLVLMNIKNIVNTTTLSKESAVALSDLVTCSDVVTANILKTPNSNPLDMQSIANCISSMKRFDRYVQMSHSSSSSVSSPPDLRSPRRR